MTPLILIFTIHVQALRGQLKALHSAVLANPILSSVPFVPLWDEISFTDHHMVLENPAPAGPQEVMSNRINQGTEYRSHFKARVIISFRQPIFLLPYVTAFGQTW